MTDVCESFFAAACGHFGAGRLAQAGALCQQILRTAPRHARAMNLLGAVARTAEHWDVAEQWMRQCLAVEPQWAEAHNNLGIVLANMNRRAEARGCFERAIALRPDYEGARLRLESLLFEIAAAEGQQLRTAPLAYVQTLFGGYAPEFEDHLVKHLEYQGHRMLEEAFIAVSDATGLEILDIGCGTGLCGTLFRRRARRLTGVDLAGEMIERSAQKQIYDELICGDYHEVLQQQRGRLDLILSADVFIYVGDIERSFAGAAGALREGGMMIFTVESFAGPGFELRRSGRFAHSMDYLKGLADQHGFEIATVLERSLRKEKDLPLTGWAVAMRKKAAP